jgi:hypothetical protein
VPPIGYLEEYDPSKGHICYREAFTEVVWYTNLDAEGRLYFYTKDGKSEWNLPDVKIKAVEAADDADEVDHAVSNKVKITKKNTSFRLLILNYVFRSAILAVIRELSS